MSNGYRTLSQHLNDLKKENFSLKLRIYFLEERMQQKYEVSREDVYKRVSDQVQQPGTACLVLVSCCSAMDRALYMGVSPVTSSRSIPRSRASFLPSFCIAGGAPPESQRLQTLLQHTWAKA